MACSLDVGDGFRQLDEYEQLTPRILYDMASAVDRRWFGRLLATVDESFDEQEMSSDLQGWLSSEVLHLGHSFERLRDAVRSFGFSNLSWMIDACHKRLVESRRLSWPSRVLCCGPGAVEDCVLAADELVPWLAGADIAETVGSAEYRNPRGTVADVADVLALLWQAARQTGQGLKPYVDCADLCAQLERAVHALKAETHVGAAQVHMVSALRAAGCKADVAWPYHPEQVAAYGYDDPLNQVHRIEVRDRASFAKSPFQEQDARRYPSRQCYVVNLVQGREIAGRTVEGMDRVILRTRRPRLDGRTLAEAVLRGSGWQISKPTCWQDEEWPAVPLLGTVRIDSKGDTDRMWFDAAEGAVLDELAARYGRVLWSGLGVLGDPGYGPKEREHLARALARQFERLGDAGALVSLELSGRPRYPELVREITAGRVAMVGINQTELLDLTSRTIEGTADGCLAWPNPGMHPESLLMRVARGVRLARYLGTEVFVHGNECNLFISDTRNKERLEHMVLAMLVAQLIVVSRLLERARQSAHVEEPVLSAKGFLALLQFARDFAEAHGDPDLADQIANAGVYCACHEDECSFAIAPVLWPSEVQRPEIDTSGAGDMSTAVVAGLLPGR